MNIQHGDARYWTTFVEDTNDGFAGFRLHRESFSGVTESPVLHAQLNANPFLILHTGPGAGLAELRR
jgi:hypothetical protein